jgi:hypothetical protein
VSVGRGATWRASATGGSSIYSYVWSDSTGARASGSTATWGPITYWNPGTKRATVVVIDSNSDSATCSGSVSITDGENAAVFSGTPVSGASPLKVQFSGVLPDPQPQGATYFISYGDGSAEYVASTCSDGTRENGCAQGTLRWNEHTYREGGVFVAKLVQKMARCQWYDVRKEFCTMDDTINTFGPAASQSVYTTLATLTVTVSGTQSPSCRQTDLGNTFGTECSRDTYPPEPSNDGPSPGTTYSLQTTSNLATALTALLQALVPFHSVFRF